MCYFCVNNIENGNCRIIICINALIAQLTCKIYPRLQNDYLKKKYFYFKWFCATENYN